MYKIEIVEITSGNQPRIIYVQKIETLDIKKIIRTINEDNNNGK